MLIVICLIKQILLFLVPYLWKTLKKICSNQSFAIQPQKFYFLYETNCLSHFSLTLSQLFFLLAARTGSRLGIYAYNQRVFQSLLRILRPSLFIMSSVVDKKLKDTFFLGSHYLEVCSRLTADHWLPTGLRSQTVNLFLSCAFLHSCCFEDQSKDYLTVKNPHTTNSKKGCLSITR